MPETFDYTRARDTARRLIKRFGQQATVNRRVTAGRASAPTITSESQQVYLMDDRRMEINDKWSLTGQLRRVLTVSTEGVPDTFTIDREDTVTVGDDELQVLEIHPFSPSGTILYWEVHVGT